MSVICYHENNVPFWLSPQWLCGNSCTWAHDVRLYIAGTNEPKSAQEAKQSTKTAKATDKIVAKNTSFLNIISESLILKSLR